MVHGGREDPEIRPQKPPPSPPLSHRPMDRSVGGGSAGSGSLLERSITPLSLGSMSSLHDVLKVHWSKFDRNPNINIDVGTESMEGGQSDSSCAASPTHAHHGHDT
ncbi:unnamed protein product [Pieris macdunnoughi]|uniref:Uncharacterized protein n=1 Tax=Pieris macdunnoughi TaxID=345717 RepID=A0A821VEY3_9NEOP|nr:unnamed protein product [Pieris macdunnoughi]